MALSNRNNKVFLFAKVVTWLYLIASFLCLAYVYYLSEIVLLGSENVKYEKYYLLFLAGTFFWGMVLRLKDEIKLNLILIVTSLMIGIYFIEFILMSIDAINRHAVNIPFVKKTAKPKEVTPLPILDPRHLKAKLAGVDYDRRTKYKVVQDLRDRGINAIPSPSPVGLFGSTNGIEGEKPLFPLGGVSNKTNVFCNESGQWTIYQSDRYGFNNPDDVWDGSTTEWMLTGDSFTQGACVKTGEDIAGQIRQMVPGNVINIGMAHNGMLSELAGLKEYAESRKPKIVIWLYFEGNDLYEFEKEKLSPLLLGYLQPNFSQNLTHRQKEIDTRYMKYIFPIYNKIKTSVSKKAKSKPKLEIKPKPEIKPKVKNENLEKDHFLFLPFIRQKTGFNRVHLGKAKSKERRSHNPEKKVSPIDPLIAEILRQARDRTASWGGKLYFVYLPYWQRYSPPEIIGDYQFWGLNRKRDEVLEIVKNLHIPIIDIHQIVFANHPDPVSYFPFGMTGHYTAEGYKEVAKAIVAAVNDDNSQILNGEN